MSLLVTRLLTCAKGLRAVEVSAARAKSLAVCFRSVLLQSSVLACLGC